MRKIMLAEGNEILYDIDKMKENIQEAVEEQRPEKPEDKSSE